MATRATIKIEGLEGICLYKHWDGYPESTLPWLEKFHTQFLSERGNDPEYEFAQLIRSSVLMAEEFELDTSTTTGWGVFNSNVDVQYRYILRQDGSVAYTG